MKNSFDKKIIRENIFKSIMAFISFSLICIFTSILFNLLEFQVPQLFIYSIFLLLTISNMSTWFLSNLKRHDLYSTAKQSSVTQLKRFKTEIENIIEELEEEEKCK